MADSHWGEASKNEYLEKQRLVCWEPCRSAEVRRTETLDIQCAGPVGNDRSSIDVPLAMAPLARSLSFIDETRCWTKFRKPTRTTRERYDRTKSSRKQTRKQLGLILTLRFRQRIGNASH